MIKRFFLLGLLALGITVYGNSVSDAWQMLINIVNAIPSADQSNDALQTVIDSNTAEISSLQSDLDELQKQVQEAQDQADQLAREQAIANLTSNAMYRGKLNNVINDTDTDFVVQLPDGNRISVAAHATQEINKRFGDYSVVVLLEEQ